MVPIPAAIMKQMRYSDQRTPNRRGRVGKPYLNSGPESCYSFWRRTKKKNLL